MQILTSGPWLRLWRKVRGYHTLVFLHDLRGHDRYFRRLVDLAGNKLPSVLVNLPPFANDGVAILDGAGSPVKPLADGDNWVYDIAHVIRRVVFAGGGKERMLGEDLEAIDRGDPGKGH